MLLAQRSRFPSILVGGTPRGGTPRGGTPRRGDRDRQSRADRDRGFGGTLRYLIPGALIHPTATAVLLEPPVPRRASGVQARALQASAPRLVLWHGRMVPLHLRCGRSRLWSSGLGTPLTQRIPRRHTRPAREAGRGRGGLSHHNDKADRVNRCDRVGENPVQLPP